MSGKKSFKKGWRQNESVGRTNTDGAAHSLTD